MKIKEIEALHSDLGYKYRRDTSGSVSTLNDFAQMIYFFKIIYAYSVPHNRMLSGAPHRHLEQRPGRRGRSVQFSTFQGMSFPNVLFSIH